MRANAKIVDEIIRKLKRLAIEYDQKLKSDKTWHYYNQHLSNDVTLTIESSNLLFNEHLESTYTEEIFEGKLSSTCYLSFQYLLTPADPSRNFKIDRILSSTYLPINEEWELPETEFAKCILHLIEKDNGYEQFTNCLYHDILYMINQVENAF